MKNNTQEENLIVAQSHNSKMGDMISMIAHQWRQPLAAIAATTIDLRMKIYFKNLEIKRSNDDFFRYIDEQLNDIETYTQSLTSIIDDFRDFYKPENKKIKAEVNHSITKAFNLIKGILTCGDIQVDFDFESKLLIEHYQNEIIHLMLNLFNNSLENFEKKDMKHKEIKIKTIDHCNGIDILFSDNGGGIKDEYLPIIFSPDFTTKDNSFGIGLGLYMAKKILKEHHNGDIIVQNNEVGLSFKMEINR